MLKNLSFVSFAFIYANILGYIFHFYVSRKLNPVLYGEFMVLYSLMLTIANFSNIFSTITAKTVIEEKKDKVGVFNYLRRIGLFLGMVICILGIVLSPILKDVFLIDKVAYLWSVSFVWLLMFSVAIERGYLQANDLFGKLAISSSLELTVRLLSVIALLWVGFGVYGAIGSSAIGLLIAFIYLFIVNDTPVGSFRKIPFTKMATIALYVSPVGFLLYADTLFIRKIFDPHTAGIFASVSVLGKATVWFCVSAFSVFFPSFVKLNLKNKSQFFNLVIYSFLFVSIFYILIEIGIFFAGKYIFTLIFGNKFEAGFRYLWIYVLSVYPLTISILFINILTAIQKFVKVIYFHLFFTYVLFLVMMHLKPNMYSYIKYYFLLNLVFSAVYAIYILIYKIRQERVNKIYRL